MAFFIFSWPITASGSARNQNVFLVLEEGLEMTSGEVESVGCTAEHLSRAGFNAVQEGDAFQALKEDAAVAKVAGQGPKDFSDVCMVLPVGDVGFGGFVLGKDLFEDLGGNVGFSQT